MKGENKEEKKKPSLKYIPTFRKLFKLVLDTKILGREIHQNPIELNKLKNRSHTSFMNTVSHFYTNPTKSSAM